MTIAAIIISSLVFLSISILFVGIIGPISRAYRQADALQIPDNAITDMPVVGTMIKMFAPYNERSWSEIQRQKLEDQLLHAGRPGGRITGAQYLAACELAGLAALLVVLGLFALGGGGLLLGFVIGIFAGLIVFWLGLEYVNNLVSERQKQISRQFPSFLDLAVMTMDAGSSFIETIEIYIRDNPGDALTEEFRILSGELSMGSTMQEGLGNFIKRVPVDHVQNAVKAVIQGQEMGTPLSQTLREQADTMRFHRSQAAERAAEELKVKMLGPTILMMVSVFLLILGPAFVEIGQSGIF